MTRIFIAAGALLLGTSSIALAADVDLGGATPVDKGAIQPGSTVDGKSTAKAGAVPTTVEAKTAAAAVPDPKLALAASQDWESDNAMPKLQTAALDSWEEATDNPKLQTELAAKADNDLQNAMGGPLEDGATTTASLTPQPAAGNYPPCDPGPGDDNCIQLYEPGVRTQLASWNRPTGGLADGSATTAMGGPYEPVADDSAAATSPEPGGDYAMNGNGVFEPHVGEVSDAELASQVTIVDSADTGLAGHDVYQGVGGPIESQAGYPPCEPGPGDDRCIQLYERGVTGTGN